jgi:predicted membrane-bound spermidine synthase
LIEYFKTDGWSWNGGSYFNPKVRAECKEALSWLNSCNDKYDAIFIDLLDPHNQNEIEFIKQLLLASKKCLKNQGALSVNVGEVSAKYTPACDIAKWMMDTFKLPDFNRNTVHVHVPSYGGEWCFLMATPVSWNHNFQFTKIPSGLKFFTREFLHTTQFWPRNYPDILQNFWKPTESEYFAKKKLVPPLDYDYSKDIGHYGC